MPRRVPWRDLALDGDTADADVVLRQLKSFDISKSNTMTCTLCQESEHKMRYRLLECSSEACSEFSTAKCAWRGKLLTCLSTKHASIYDYDHHCTSAASPKKKTLTATQKDFCREMADHHLRPMRIRHALSGSSAPASLTHIRSAICEILLSDVFGEPQPPEGAEGMDTSARILWN
ncbi:hypothetical protein PC110_g10489 [Phytophthora cactorum]|uniref:Uncharacterized protein n=1 Tax=Phytophthora cactorum TaxID=29920 RepID=A0A329SC13_9STRA|nr:hypothetical protein PC114_g14993 [Phytophthora cactorum]RAW33178.1 hypothetical protein PC110_g10489 [Phytophthora cactorum]